MGKGIFSDITILDFSNNLAGPCGSAMFADQGANVIKIERPITGDDTRVLYPVLNGTSIQYMWDNRGKKSIVLALNDPEAQQLIYKMVEKADVVLESFKPGQMKKFGLDYDTLVKYNEKLIYCSVSACGQTGPYAKEPGFDIIAQGMSGLMDMAGEPDGPPTKMGTTVGDYLGSFNVFGSISAALYHRDRTGEGQYIDISLMAGLVSCNTSADIAATVDTHPTRIGPHDNTVVPYGVFEGNNGETAVVVACTFGLWPKMCRLLGKEEWLSDPEFATGKTRILHRLEIIETINTFLKQFETMDEAIAVMKQAGIPCTKIKSTYEVAHDPGLWIPGYMMEHPMPKSCGEVTYKGRGPWIKMSKTPFEMKAAPDLGENNYEILEQFGWSKEKIDEMEARWAAPKK